MPINRERYHRQMILPDVGEAGQQRLAAAKVLVIGMGGLGCPISAYLAAAGVGTIGIADNDRVERSNLHRQILHRESTVGAAKTASVASVLSDLNPDVHIIRYDDGIAPANALERFRQFDLIVDGSDNFPTRYLNNDAAFFAAKPLVYGSIFRFEGQVSVFAAQLGGPCYRCLFPSLPLPGSVPNCAEAGVFGALCGIVGSWQASEAIKLILGIGQPLIGKLKVLNTLTGRDRVVAIKRDPDCPLCSASPAIHSIQPNYYVMSCEPRSLTAAAHSVAEEVLPIELAESMAGEQPPILLDVREPDEHEYCRIRCPQRPHDEWFIPVGQLMESCPQLPADRDIVAYCHHGMRSLHAARYLRERGHQRVRSLKGGIDAWSRLIDPAIRRY